MSIKFEIYRDGSRVMNFAPQGAIAIGPESVPIPGEVHFKDGLLVCEKTDDHATATGLLWDCGPVGTYHVETTRLPPREKPYNLNVELARFRTGERAQDEHIEGALGDIFAGHVRIRSDVD